MLTTKKTKLARQRRYLAREVQQSAMVGARSLLGLGGNLAKQIHSLELGQCSAQELAKLTSYSNMRSF